MQGGRGHEHQVPGAAGALPQHGAHRRHGGRLGGDPPGEPRHNTGCGVTTCLPQYTEQQLPRTAGVLLLGTGGSAPPHSTTYFETACEIEDERTIHPFAFRTHTHSLGELVFGLVRKHPRAIPVAYEAVYHVSSAPRQQGAGVTVTCITTLWIPGRAQFT